MPYEVRLSCCALPRTPRERRSKAKRLRQFRRNHKESREIACPLWTYRVSIPQKTQRRFWGKPQAVANRKDEEPLLHLAKVRDTTPTEIANKVHMSQIKFFKFCRKYFDCTATELIARVQGEE